MKQWIADDDMCATESSRRLYQHLSSRNELTFHRYRDFRSGSVLMGGSKVKIESLIAGEAKGCDWVVDMGVQVLWLD